MEVRSALAPSLRRGERRSEGPGLARHSHGASAFALKNGRASRPAFPLAQALTPHPDPLPLRLSKMAERERNATDR